MNTVSTESLAVIKQTNTLFEIQLTMVVFLINGITFKLNEKKFGVASVTLKISDYPSR